MFKLKDNFYKYHHSAVKWRSITSRKWMKGYIYGRTISVEFHYEIDLRIIIETIQTILIPFDIVMKWLKAYVERWVLWFGFLCGLHM